MFGEQRNTQTDGETEVVESEFEKKTKERVDGVEGSGQSSEA